MIELTTSLFMLASAFSPISVSAIGQESPRNIETAPVATETADHPVTLESYVRDYFSDTPILAEIARCESTFRQHGSNGEVLRGKVNSGDIGIMQINKYYHEEDATKLGFDIYTLEGNLGYAKWLYRKYDSDPWVHSSKCWKGNPKVAMK
jgi:hypothetical protein